MGKEKLISGGVKLGVDVAEDILAKIMGMVPGKGAPPTVNLPAGSDPRYLGAAPDRSDMTFLRYGPKKPSARLTAALTALRDPENPIRTQMMSDIQRGVDIGGADWYNTEELRDWFTHYLGDERGDAEWRDFMYLMGTTSPGSKVDANIGNASAVRNRMAMDPAYVEGLQGAQNLKDASLLAQGRPKGYGHKTQGLQELATSRYAQGQWQGTPEPGVAATKGSWMDQPKPKGFSNSLLGNSRNIAPDLHFTRYMAMAARSPDWLDSATDVSKEFMDGLIASNPASAKYFSMRNVNGKPQPSFNPKNAVNDGVVSLDEIADYPSVWASKPNDNEYADIEVFTDELGKELGMTPAQVQAALWMGAADRTGVDVTSQGTFMDLLRRRADKRAKAEGMTREQIIERFIVDKGLLALPAGAFGVGAMMRPSQAQASQLPPEEEVIQWLKQIEDRR